MKVELKEIIEQLNEAIGLAPGFSVAALCDDVGKGIIDGWTIVRLVKNDDDTATPIILDKFVKYKTIKELLISQPGFRDDMLNKLV